MKLVCPHDRALIERLSDRQVCVRVKDARDVVSAAADVRQRNTLVCVICETKVPLAELEVADDWHRLPIALMTPSVGRFRDGVATMRALRDMNVRVYLPCDAENLVGARILASLGIAVCVTLDGASEWDALADLAAYALLGLVPHAPVDPFQTIADAYRTAARSADWGHIYFDDPSRYLHLDATGRVALSRRDADAGLFIAPDPDHLDSPDVKRAIENRSEAWRSLFAEDHFCARCQAWRICRARLRDDKDKPDGCESFFAEMQDVIERRREQQNKPAATWRP